MTFKAMGFWRTTALRERNDAVRLGTRERAEQDRVHHAEHGRISADPKCKRENGDGREAWTLAQHAQSVAKVLTECAHGLLSLTSRLSSPAPRPFLLC